MLYPSPVVTSNYSRTIVCVQCLLLILRTKVVTPNQRHEAILSNQERQYRIAYPHPEDYVIEMLVNPCGVNDTDIDSDNTFPLGYDCCMNRYGRGEFGFMKYVSSRHAETSNDALNHAEVFERRIPAGPDEVLHNMVIVDENGAEIPHEYSRRADDHTIIDESCRGLRDPHSSCLDKRLRAFNSPYVPACWDHNQTVDSTASCYTPYGDKKPNCMQVSYSQNAYIDVCGGKYSVDPNCGTFIEIHRANGSPYDSETVSLSDTKITIGETNGMTTTTIDLTYKHQANRILCAYNESKMRVGSMVRVTEESPRCCCPPRYNKLSKLGGFFCPRKKGLAGPFVDSFDTLTEKLDNDRDQQVYPYCHNIKENEDILHCSKDIGGEVNLGDAAILDALIGKDHSLFFTEICQTIELNDNGHFSSNDLNGEYYDTCALGQAFQACGASDNDGKCIGNDTTFDFHNKIGQVTHMPSDEKDILVGVTFNDGRTEYYFSQEFLELQQPQSNYELWFVHRNRFEKVLKKRKGFKVVWPECTFDTTNDRYFPFAQISQDSNVVKVLVDY